MCRVVFELVHGLLRQQNMYYVHLKVGVHRTTFSAQEESALDPS